MGRVGDSVQSRPRVECRKKMPGPWIEHGTSRMRLFSLLLSQLSYPGTQYMLFIITTFRIVALRGRHCGCSSWISYSVRVKNQEHGRGLLSSTHPTLKSDSMHRGTETPLQ